MCVFAPVVGESSSSEKFGLRTLHPILLNNSSIPTAVQADVNLNIAPCSLAYFLASASLTCSFSIKSLLLAAIPITIFIIKLN